MVGWIGVDLDGTLARYDGWVDVHVIGAPIPQMVERVRRWIRLGYDVRIFTARICHDDSALQVRRSEVAYKAINEWCQEHLGKTLPITNVKDLEMLELWDDRAVQVITNEGTPMGPSIIGG